MGISGASGSSGYQSPAALEAERAVLVLKKQQEAMKAQAQAVVQLIEGASPNVGTRLSVYA